MTAAIIYRKLNKMFRGGSVWALAMTAEQMESLSARPAPPCR